MTPNQANHRIFEIALTLLPGVGPVLAKNLVAYCGSAEAIFQEKKQKLLKIPGIGQVTAEKITGADVLQRAEKEMVFAQKNNIEIHFFLDKDFPQRLENCLDAPILLYTKGHVNLNAQRALAIVGTRKATAYGKDFTQNFIKELKQYMPTVVSGMAYGIDFIAHKACVDEGVPTLAVFAHGLDRIYPQIHTKVAQQMLELGGWVTEYPLGTNPDRENFPMRNRIIAALADATIVVEAAERGGALITAEIATTYNRDVFAVPGRVSDVYSEGCNKLIFQNKAAVMRHAQDLEFYLGWEMDGSNQKTKKTIQPQLLFDLSPEEEKIAEVLKSQEKIHIETLCIQTEMPVSKVVTVLFDLEMRGAVRTYPGKVYEWLAG